MASSRSAWAAWPPDAAAPAIAITTTGVTMPSLRPLSTVITRRIRGGTAGLVTTGKPSAASVGASAAPTTSARQAPNPGNSHAAHPGEQPADTPPAGQQGGRQADGEQPPHQRGVAAQVVDAHPGGIGE